MVEWSKLGKVQVLVVGFLLVKLALLLFFYYPALWGSSHAVATAQPTGHAAQPRLPPSEPASQSSSFAPGQAENSPLTPISQSTRTHDAVWEPVRQLIAALEQQRAALVSKEAQLRQEQEQLALLKTALREEFEGLASLRMHVNELLKKKAEVEEEDLKRLARVYEATAPEQSSTLLGRLDAALAARILSRMNGPKAGKILGTMDPAQAARVTEQLAKQKE